jgi:xanthine dehydrogenase small subunit
MTSSRDSIDFLLGFTPRRLRGVDPTMTVLQWLRRAERLCGSKEGCAEGDCGACTVVLAEPAGDALRYRAVNACILFVPELDGTQLITVEHLADAALHPVQQAMVEHHASQCGFCTPGFVMSLFAALHGAAPVDRDAVDTVLAGNLCRCTGYRPIADAALAVPGGPDRFDLVADATLAALRALPAGSLALQHGTRRYFAPETLAELAALRLAYPEAAMLAGGTDVGLWVTKQHRVLETVIALGGVAELCRIETDAGALRIGAGVRYSEALQAMAALHPALGAMVTRIGSVQVRNSGTIGGNIANASPIGDMPPALIALDATLVLRRGAVQRRLPIAAFFLAYRQTALQPGEFVERIDIPALPDDAVFGVHKVSKRPDQDISAVCGAFLLRVSDGVVTEARLAYGGMAGIPARAARAEQALVGRVWDEAGVRAAMAALAEDFTPLSDMRATAAYRATVARNLLLKLWLEQAA